MRQCFTLAAQEHLLRRIKAEAYRFEGCMHTALHELERSKREGREGPVHGASMAALKRVSMDLSKLLPLIRGTRKDRAS
jgi:hypothetical protein